MTMSRIIDWAADLVFPNRCPFCGGFIVWDKLTCEKCANAIELAEFCPKCGKHRCDCGEWEHYYDGCAVAVPYVGTARDGVLALKYHNGFNTAKYLVPALTSRMKECCADIITAVPMTRARRSETGYNQAEYIAKCLSKYIGVPCDFRLIGKSKTARTQHELSAEQRREAVRGAYFELSHHKDINGKTIILCDDIITTGSTLSECAYVLKSMGAESVYCAVLAGSCHRNIATEEGI